MDIHSFVGLDGQILEMLVGLQWSLSEAQAAQQGTGKRSKGQKVYLAFIYITHLTSFSIESSHLIDQACCNHLA